jgi:hypothetical protein
MRIYIFKSETRKELRAFAGDPGGSKLPSLMVPGPLLGLSGRLSKKTERPWHHFLK